MEIEQDAVYTCGKPMMRKVISIEDGKVTYAKCMTTSKHPMYVIGGGTHLLETILMQSFRRWAKGKVE